MQALPDWVLTLLWLSGLIVGAVSGYDYAGTGGAILGSVLGLFLSMAVVWLVLDDGQA